MLKPTLGAWPATTLLALAAAVAFAPSAGAQDAVTLADGRRISNVTILRDNYDGVAIDREGDGEADDVFDPEKVVRVEYGDAPPAYRQAELELRQGRLEQAVEQLQRALAEEDAKPFWVMQYANYHLGESLRRIGQADETMLEAARRAYREVLVEAPLGRKVPHSIRGLGLTYLDAGEPRRAESEFAKLAGEERYGGAWNLRGKLLLARAKGAQGNYEAGLALCDEAAEAAQQAGLEAIAAEAVRARAAVLLAAGQLEPAYEAFMQIARTADEGDHETLAAAYNGIGDALLGQGNAREALLAYLRVRVLYFQATDEVPRALYGAAKGFAMQREGAKARGLVSRLQKEYPRSIWTARAVEELGGG